jgi:hypothetical protein
VLRGEITKQHRAIVGYKKSLKLQQEQFQAKQNECDDEMVSYKESLIQQRDCFETVLEGYREEYRQEVEYNDMLSMQVTRRDSELDACRRYQTDIEEFIQMVTDMMKQALGIEDTDEIDKVRVFEVDTLGISEHHAVLCSKVSLHEIQREKST